jgi:tripartite-type tricarboxylate transporter receptor subunit TctC
MVAESPADGYTLLVHTNAHAYSAALLTNLPYDPLIDFVPVAALTTQSYVLVASETAAVTTISGPDGCGEGKAGGAAVRIDRRGHGHAPGIEKFNLAAGINATHVPARGSDAIADTIANVIAGRTDYALLPIPTTLPQIVAGRLAARREQRSALKRATRRSDAGGGRRPRLRFPDLVRDMGAGRHSSRSRSEARPGHRACPV